MHEVHHRVELVLAEHRLHEGEHTSFSSCMSCIICSYSYSSPMICRRRRGNAVRRNAVVARSAGDAGAGRAQARGMPVCRGRRGQGGARAVHLLLLLVVIPVCSPRSRSHIILVPLHPRPRRRRICIAAGRRPGRRRPKWPRRAAMMAALQRRQGSSEPLPSRA